MELFRLFGSVVIDNDDAIKSLKEADKQARDSKRAFRDMGDTIKKMGKIAAVGVIGATTALVGLAKKSAAAGDEIHKGSQRMGISTDAYQELDYWAGQNGMSQENLEKGVGRLNTRLGEAAAGNEKYANALEALGVPMDEVKAGAISTEDAFATSIQTLSEMENEQEKAALASELFGKKLGRELLPALNDGSLSIEDAKKKAHEMGIVMGEDAVNGAANLTDMMDDAERSFGAIFRQIGENVMPILLEFLEWIVANMPVIQEKIQVAMEKGKEYVDKLKDGFQFLKDNANLLIPVLAGLVAGFVAFKVISTINGMVEKAKLLMIALKGTTFAQTVAQHGLNAALMANPIGLVIAAITALIAIGVALYMNWDTVKAKAQGLWNKIKQVGTGISNAFSDMKNKSIQYVSGLVSGAMSKFNSMRTRVSTTFSKIYNAIMNPINRAKSAVQTAINKMKSYFNFSWKLPKIKMPKFSVSGSANPLKWLKEGVPKLSVRWNAEGGIFDRPTIFNTSKGMQGVGEAGPEAIMPLSKLEDMLNLEKNKNNEINLSVKIKEFNNNTDEDVENLSERLAFEIRRKLAGEGIVIA